MPSKSQARTNKRKNTKALPTGWVKTQFAERATAQVEAYSKEVEAAAAMDLPRGRPKQS